ncbi:PIG-L family deacetylase [candidate division KSB1 bacterium]|nr:PIG-L family deacetylase [candidate division KSB1 bacterium]NIV71084.1 hypothetical protein [Phycisphaerae bacterium]NIR72363.1 PIG-L family deacetylase [candidate division KSB1 bacterium]NIS28366.1 PIG-L family deacetylase [candidate division KSB1 bacterium]NIT75247.1 PIG-L family deacetylase [candidate division KSB1 bacterium]
MRSILQRTTTKLLLKYAPPEMIVLLKSFNAHQKSKNGPPFPHKNIFVTDSVPRGRVLVLAPHPDDEAIGMGGALSKHVEKKARITVLYMTNGGGGGTSNGELIEIRRKEAETLGEKFHIEQIFWDNEDTCLTNDSQTVSALINVLENVQPDVVYLPSFFDHHFDHFSANQILVDAVRKMPSMQMTILGYEVWDNMPFPNYILNISSGFEKKAEILSYYKTPLKATDFIKLCKYRDAVHYTLYVDSGRRETQGYAEAFYCFDCETYQALYEHYLHSLQQNHSLLPSHVDAQEQMV